MAKNQIPYFTKTPIHKSVTFVNADGAATLAGANTKEIVADPGADDGIVRMISITTDDTANNDILFFISPDGGTTKYLLWNANVPLGSGFNSSVYAVNGLGSTPAACFRVDKDGNRFIVLKNGYNLYAGMKTAVTAAKTVVVSTTLEKYS
jgi:hypothetical protein